MKKTQNFHYYLGGIVSLIVCLVYLPSIQNGFVNWDDNNYVYQNLHIRSLGFDFFKWIFGFHASNWHPLTWVSHAIDYALWGLNPTGHHFSSIILHSMNTFLVALLIFTMLNNLKSYKAESVVQQKSQYNFALTTSLIAAALFGIHPIHVESVAWISERKDVLCAFFVLSSLIMYVQFVIRKEQNKRHFYFASLFFFMLALMSKPMAVTLPIILLLMDIYPFKRLSFQITREDKTILKEKIPFFILSLFSTMLTIIAQQAGGSIKSFTAYPLGTRLVMAIKGIFFYLSKMIIPAGLAPYYPYPVDISLFSFQYAFPIVFFLIISIFCFLLWKRGKKIFLTIWVCYIVTLIPVIGIIQIGQQAAADRYTYLPSIGIFLLLGLGIATGIEKVGLQHPVFLKKRKSIAALPIILVFCLLTGLTIHQTKIWKNSLSLWNAELQMFPNVYTAYVSRGLAYTDSGNYTEALSDFEKAIKMEPYNALLYMNRGVVLAKMKNYRAALEDYTTAIKLDPLLTPAYYNRGLMFLNSGIYYDAMIDFTIVISLEPQDTEAYYNRGIAYERLGNNDQALKDFQIAGQLGGRR